MRTDMTNPADVEHRLWEEIESHHTGMLMPVTGARIHAQPMTAFPERGTRQLWFFTRTDTDLAKHVGKGAPAMFMIQLKGLQACIGVELRTAPDPSRMERYWNAVVAAWGLWMLRKVLRY